MNFGRKEDPRKCDLNQSGKARLAHLDAERVELQSRVTQPRSWIGPPHHCIDRVHRCKGPLSPFPKSSAWQGYKSLEMRIFSPNQTS